MTTNPYAAPKADLGVDVEAEIPGSPAKALFVGLVIDVGCSFLCGFVLTVIHAAWLARSGISPEDISVLLGHIDPSSWLFISSSAAGLGFSMLGGYLCARIAKKNEYRLALILAAISATTGLVMGTGSLSLLVNTLEAIGSILFIMLGARIGVAKNRRLRI